MSGVECSAVVNSRCTRRHTLTFLFILLLGAALRLFRLTYQSLWFDETASAWMSTSIPFHQMWERVVHDYHPPLYFIALWGWSKLFGGSEWSLRFFSAACGIAAIGLFYRVARRLLTDYAVPFAALLFVTSLYQIWFSQEVRQYELLTFVALFYADAFLLWKERTSALRTGYFVVSTVALLFTHYLSMLLILSMGCYLLLRERQRLASWGLHQAVAALAFLPWAPTFFSQARQAAQTLWTSRPDAADLFVLPVQLLRYTIPSLATSLISLVAAALVVFSCRFLKTSPTAIGRSPTNTHTSLLLTCWIAIPIIVSWVLSQFLTPVFVPKAFAFVSPALCLLLAVTTRTPVGRIVSLCVVFLSMSAYPWYYRAHHKEQWREASQFLVPKLLEKSAVTFPSPWCDIALRYYAGSAYQTVPYGSVLENQEVWVVVAESHEKGAAVVQRYRYLGFTLRQKKRFTGIEIFNFKRKT